MERAILAGVNLGGNEDAQRALDELKALAKACEMEPVGVVMQNMDAVNKAFYIGTGKVAEIKQLAELLDADILVFDEALSPIQLRNLQQEIGKPVMDRTTLILEIFSRRARTREAKLQVEVAQLQYTLPRLVGLHDALRHQGGGSGLSNKGAGEKKLELDRRRIEKRIGELKKELTEVERERKTQSKQRNESDLLKVALVGYTNAGKSTLMNRLIEHCALDGEKKVFEKD
ncbi:MAG: GTPase HflX, partial [Lachnospiraceae bacterium]|nr:GTPase HflX [Lachnospiraceae bacterium]